MFLYLLLVQTECSEPSTDSFWHLEKSSRKHSRNHVGGFSKRQKDLRYCSFCCEANCFHLYMYIVYIVRRYFFFFFAH